MVLAFGAMEPLVVAAAALSRGVLVAAAGVVVVLAILLVFVMVLRGSGSSRQKASGLDYDAQEGPLGQPQAPANDAGSAPWAGAQANGFDAMDQGYGQGFGQGRAAAPSQQPASQAQGWGQPFGEPAQAGNAAQWGAPADTGGRWNEQMAPAGGQMGGQMGGLNDWGAPPQGRPAANAWDAPAPNAGPAWSAGAPGQQPMSARPGMGAANPWDAQPAQAQPAWDAQPAAPSKPSWGGQPAAPSQPAWGAPQQAAPSQPSWSGQPAAPSQPSWGGQPAAPSQPAWGAQPGAGMMQQAAPRGGFDIPRLVERKQDGSGREFDLRKDRLTIGRHRESDVFLEDLAVSRLHTTVSRDGAGRYIVRDENSANGTYVNGQRITEQPLKDGDEVQVGQTVLVFQQR
ncbi:MAG TPA: FHA domain-containing protein [Ktedonobacterales bacterium]